MPCLAGCLGQGEEGGEGAGASLGSMGWGHWGAVRVWPGWSCGQGMPVVHSPATRPHRGQHPTCPQSDVMGSNVGDPQHPPQLWEAHPDPVSPCGHPGDMTGGQARGPCRVQGTMTGGGQAALLPGHAGWCSQFCPGLDRPGDTGPSGPGQLPTG